MHFFLDFEKIAVLGSHYCVIIISLGILLRGYKDGDQIFCGGIGGY
jgi:hypothetical protein